MAEIEYGHYKFWRKYSSNENTRLSSILADIVVILRIFFGATFAARLLEKFEDKVVSRYREVMHLIPENDRSEFDKMLLDEESHEHGFSTEFDESHVKYLSFIILGLADALVEIAGIHAGSLGVYNSTRIAGLAGVIAGAAASIAMASAAYAQARSAFKGSAGLSAVYTGVSYFIAAIILATPYFLTPDMMEALVVSLTLGIIMIAFVSFYGSVISGSMFKKDFLEFTTIILGATVALYILGTYIKYLLGITI